VQCARNTTTCKKCNEVIHSTQKKEHLKRWRDGRRIKYFIESGEDSDLKIAYDHGANPDAILDKTTNETALHFVARFNSIHCFIVLLGQGVEKLD
jgi:hypothetical protein